MADLPMPVNFDLPGDNDTPLPLIVAKRWNFPLAHIETEDGFYYAVQDWIRGLTGEEDIRLIWVKLKKQDIWQQLFTSSKQFPYVASNGKKYQMHHTMDKGLYLIAQYLRVTKARPVLDQIRKFLAAAGAFVDEVRLDPEQAIDAGIAGFREQGHDDAWILARIEGKVMRNLFTAALAAAVVEMLKRYHYAMATDDIYKGLWGRTAAYLKKELELPKKANLRDHQPRMALLYQGIAEEMAAQDLGDRQELTWNEARKIVQDVAVFVGEQARLSSHRQKIDFATGRRLLE